MDMKIGNSIFLNKAPPQKMVLAPGAIIRGNTVFVNMTMILKTFPSNLSIEYHFIYDTKVLVDLGSFGILANITSVKTPYKSQSKLGFI